MSYKSSLLCAWSIFVGIILITFSVDYYIRVSGDDFYYSGLNEYLWIIALLAAIFIGGYFMIYSMKDIKNNVYKVLHLIINIVFGIAFYIISSYLYVVGFGIDSV